MEKIAIYGAGAFGKIFYEALKEFYEIEFFIDEFTTLRTLFEKRIYRPEEAPKIKVLISLLQYSQIIEEKLKDMDFQKVLSFQESVLENPNIFKVLANKKYLWLTNNTSEMLSDKLIRVKELLKDQKSKDILEKFIKFRSSLDPIYYVKPKDKEYFPSDINIFQEEKDLNIVDCGAYIGDSLENFVNNFENVSSIISFEPDVNNVNILIDNIGRLKYKYINTDFIVYPSGVYSDNRILKFTNNTASSSSHIDDTSSFEIPVVSLDKTLLGMKVDYIKMDIEGAEKQALLGAKNIINKYKPSLAICLYHKPEDLWELPLLIKEIEPSYEMYLRVHEDMFLSTVLYCIPN